MCVCSCVREMFAYFSAVCALKTGMKFSPCNHMQVVFSSRFTVRLFKFFDREGYEPAISLAMSEKKLIFCFDK